VLFEFRQALLGSVVVVKERRANHNKTVALSKVIRDVVSATARKSKVCARRGVSLAPFDFHKRASGRLSGNAPVDIVEEQHATFNRLARRGLGEVDHRFRAVWNAERDNVAAERSSLPSQCSRRLAKRVGRAALWMVRHSRGRLCIVIS